jgi:hypothetical protein
MDIESPISVPSRNWELEGDGQPSGQIGEGRRQASYRGNARHLGVAKDSICRWIEDRSFCRRSESAVYEIQDPEVDEWVRAGGADCDRSKKGDS